MCWLEPENSKPWIVKRSYHEIGIGLGGPSRREKTVSGSRLNASGIIHGFLSEIRLRRFSARA